MSKRSMQRLFTRMQMFIIALIAGAPHAHAAWWNEGLKHVGSLSNLPGYAWDVKVDGERAYLQIQDPKRSKAYPATFQYLAIIDVENSGNPRLVATLDTSDTLKRFDIGDGKLFTVETRYFIDRKHPNRPAKALHSRVNVFNLERPEKPKMLGSYKTIAIQAFKAEGSRAYLALGNGMLEAIDFSDPAKPRVLGSATINSGPTENLLAVSQNRAFLTTADKALVVNIADPKKMKLERSLPYAKINNAYSLLVHEEKLFTGNREGFHIFNWKLHPSESELTTINQGCAGAMAFSHSRLFIPMGAQGVRVIDASNIYSNDFMRGYYLTPGDACAVAAREHLLYVATGQRGLTILKFED